MSLPVRVVVLLSLLLAGPAWAQTETIDPPESATPVIVTTPPKTVLDSVDRMPGLSVRGLTSVGSLTDDRGGTIEVFAVTIESKAAGSAKVRGLAIVVTRKDGQAARAYVDEDEIHDMIDGVKALAALDRGGTPMKDTRGVYRTRGDVAVLNVDDNGGRMAIVRTLTVSPLTNQATWAAAKFRANRLNELARYLQTAKDTLDKAK